MRNLLKLALLFLLAQPVFATTYFLLPAQQGTHDGLSWTNAKAAGSVFNGSSTQRSVSGDLYCLGSGTYGYLVPAQGANGTAVNEIRAATAADAQCGSSVGGWSSGYDTASTPATITYSGRTAGSGTPVIWFQSSYWWLNGGAYSTPKSGFRIIVTEQWPGWIEYGIIASGSGIYNSSIHISYVQFVGGGTHMDATEMVGVASMSGTGSVETINLSNGAGTPNCDTGQRCIMPWFNGQYVNIDGGGSYAAKGAQITSASSYTITVAGAGTGTMPNCPISSIVVTGSSSPLTGVVTYSSACGSPYSLGDSFVIQGSSCSGLNNRGTTAAGGGNPSLVTAVNGSSGFTFIFSTAWGVSAGTCTGGASYPAVTGAVINGGAEEQLDFTGTAGTPTTNDEIDHCYFINTANSPYQGQNTTGMQIHDNIFSADSSTPQNHGNQISQDSTINTSIYRNVFEDCEGTSCANTGVNHGPDTNLRVYDNISIVHSGNPFHQQGTGNGIFSLLQSGESSASNGLYYYDNTVVNQSGTISQQAGLLFDADSGATITNCFIRNNLVYGNSVSIVGVTLLHCSEDHNSAIYVASAPEFAAGSDVVTTNNVAGVPFTGGGTNWSGTCTSSGGALPTCSGEVYTLANAGTSYWDSRVSLGSPYDTDFAGNAFTSSRGAYQYGGTPQAATPTFSPVAGTYSTTQTVTISDTTTGTGGAYTAGPLIVGTGASVANAGSKGAWTSPGNITAEDGTVATSVGIVTGGGYTDWLRGTMTPNVFAIPAGATINGILVEMKMSATTANLVYTNGIQLVKAGTAAGTAKNGPGAYYGNTLAYESWGSSSDLWGTTWAPADINNAGFGAQFWSEYDGGLGTKYAYCDDIRITVYYTTSSVPATLCFTTDGSTPTEVSHACSGGTTQTYSTPITVNTTKTVKALATLSGYTDSSVGTALYTFLLPSVAPTSIAFGTVTQGTSSSPQTVTLTNNSALTITLTGTSLTGSYPTEFSLSSNTCNSGTVTAGSTCTVNVQFNPTQTPGTYETATLNISYTGSSGSPQTVSLSGTSGTPGTPPVNSQKAILLGALKTSGSVQISGN